MLFTTKLTHQMLLKSFSPWQVFHEGQNKHESILISEHGKQKSQECQKLFSIICSEIVRDS